MKNPQTVNELRAILGLVGFYRRFIQDFGKIVEPLHKLLNKKQLFQCGKSMNRQLNTKIFTTESTIFGLSEYADPYMLTTDGSLFGIGATISQRQQWDERVIAYANKTLSKSQRNYSATKGELFAIV